jgi:hypothetical protein
MSNRAWPLVATLIITAITACHSVPSYPNVAAVPAADQIRLQNIESFYLSKAREQAAFSLHCSGDQLTMQVVSRRPHWILAESRDQTFFSVQEAEPITTIGADGCGARATFQVVCGPHQRYGGVAGKPYGNPCDVASSEAASTIVKNTAEQERIDTAAAAAASTKK